MFSTKNMKDFSFYHRVTYGPEQQEYPTASCFDVVFITTPDIVCHINDSNWKIPANSILLFNNIDVYRLSLNSSNRYERYVFSFKPEYIQGFSSKETDLLECFFLRSFSNPYVLPLSALEAKECLTYVKQIIAYNEKANSLDYGYDLRNKFLLGELLIFINNLYRTYHGISSNTVNTSYRLIYAVMNHIHTHLDDDLSLDHLSSEFFINKYYLCNLFKTVTGTSPTHYIINCRLLKAKELLALNYSVDSVCTMVGYKNLSHFSRIFKDYVGLSPKQYAKFKQSADFN